MKRFAIIAIILPLSLGGCAAGYSSEKGWHAGFAVTPEFIRDSVTDYRNIKRDGYKK